MNTFLMWLLQSTLVSSVAIVFLAISRKALRIPSRWRYALWIAIAICLLLPARLSIPVTNGQAAIYVKNIDTAINVPISLPGQLDPYSAPDTPDRISMTAITSIAVPTSRSFAITTGHVFFVLWLCGALISLLYIVLANIRFARRTHDTTSCEAGQAECDVLRTALGLHRYIPVAMTKRANSPCVAAFPTRILLTPAALRDRETLRHALLHELCHIRQHDLTVAWFRAAALVIHWFNPLVWWAAGASRSDAELSCDTLALTYLPAEEAPEYGISLLCIAAPTKVSRTLAAAGFFSKGGSLRDRIKLIADQPHKRITVTTITIALALVLAACSLVSHASVTDAPESEKAAAVMSMPTTPPVMITPDPVVTATPKPIISPDTFAEPVDLNFTDPSANDRYTEILMAWQAGARPETPASTSPYETGFAILPVRSEAYGFDAIAILPRRMLTAEEMLQFIDGLGGQPLNELTTYQVLIAGQHVETNRPWTETEAQRYHSSLNDEFLYKKRNPTFDLTPNPIDHDIARVKLNPAFENGLEEMALFPAYEMTDEQIMAFIGDHYDYRERPESEYRPDDDDISKGEAIAITNTWTKKLIENSSGSVNARFSGSTESWNVDLTPDEGLLDLHVILNSHSGELINAIVLPKMVARPNENSPGGMMVPIDGLSLDTVYQPDDPAVLNAALDFTEKHLLTSNETITQSNRIRESTVNMRECMQFDIQLSSGTKYGISVTLSDLSITLVEKDGGLRGITR